MSTIKNPTAKRLLSFDRANEVTSLSKILAATLFIIMPFLGFLVGYLQAGGSMGL
jgi:hypothetical protein